mgnify:FL=1
MNEQRARLVHANRTDPWLDAQQRKCQDKRRYVSKRIADIWADHHLETHGTLSGAYRCKHCKQWHLSSRVRDRHPLNNPVGDNWAQVTYGLVPRANDAQPTTAALEQQ